MTNIEIYQQLAATPTDALRAIQAGRLKGKSDINPQWRYEAMTQAFGLCGVGWKFAINTPVFKDGDNGQIAVFVEAALWVKVDGEWSEPIPGNGGSMFIANEKYGPHTSDEAIKMAVTDALSTAMKMIGVAADVYRGKTKHDVQPQTKYEEKPAQPKPTQPKPEAKPALAESSEAYKKAIDWLVGNGSLHAITKKYDVSNKVLKSLTAAVEAAKTKQHEPIDN